MKSTFVSVLMSLYGAYIDLGIVISEMKYKKLLRKRQRTIFYHFICQICTFIFQQTRNYLTNFARKYIIILSFYNNKIEGEFL